MSVSAKAAKGHLPKPWCRAYGEALHRACNELESLISAGCPVCESADRVAGQFNGAVVDRAQDKRLRLVSGRSLLRHLYYWRGHGRTPECLVPQYFGPLTGEYRRQPRVKYYAVRGFLPIRRAFVKLKVAGALREDFTLDQFIGCFPSVARKLSTLAAAQAQHQKAVREYKGCLRAFERVGRKLEATAK
ncbi:MAG TPA: hypothetical protein P5186_19905 [Candidatus Paceibacterota bacterium]|nr:hypothetical protein [Verrucomicrobiota bacterium]HRY50324.1 hypothetical protein [Candidatus Paceibacterota bacterium]